MKRLIFAIICIAAFCSPTFGASPLKNVPLVTNFNTFLVVDNTDVKRAVLTTSIIDGIYGYTPLALAGNGSQLTGITQQQVAGLTTASSPTFAGVNISGAGVGKPILILAQSAVPVSVGGTLNEITLASVTVPGGLMGLNGAVRISSTASVTNSANNKTIRVKFGNQNIQQGAVTTSLAINTQTTIRNRNSASSQLVPFNGNANSSLSSPFSIQGTGYPNGTFSVNTAADVLITIAGTTTLETGFTPSPTSNISGTGSVVTVIQTAHGLNTGEYIKASGSSTAGYNVDPVQITKIDANTFTYAGTGTGTPGTAPLIQRYSVITLEGYTIELLPGAN